MSEKTDIRKPGPRKHGIGKYSARKYAAGKLGAGTLSPVLFILAFLFTVKIGRTFCLGDIILEGMGIHFFWRFRINVLVSGILLGAGYLLGRKYPDDEGAELGRKLCAVFGTAVALIVAGGLLGVDLLYPLYEFPSK